MTRNTMTFGLVLLASSAAQANPPSDAMKSGLCLEMKINGRSTPCNSDLRMVDDGKGEVTFVTGFGDDKTEPKIVVAFSTAQTPEMENAYGYALRLTTVTLMPFDKPDSQRHWPAKGLCFMVKPNPVRAGAKPIRQDIVVLCSASLADVAAPVRKIDWKFVF